MINTITPMPSRLQRLAAFGGFLAYLITQAQVDAHRKQRAQLLEARPMPAADPTPVFTYYMPEHDAGEEQHSAPHIHEEPAAPNLRCWPHSHDG